MASSIRGRMVTPSSSTWRGSSDAGPHTPPSAPSLVRPQMLLRATRLCRMSPQIAILSPLIRPNRSRSVSMSSRPWVGCSCLPSPALITLERMRCPRNCAAPEAPCRITTMSIRIASRFLAVSTRVSPLLTDEPAAATFTVSAESRFSANSNEIRVRVDASKNKFTMVFPRRAGTFLIARSLTSLNGSAVSRISWICSALSGSSPTRSLPRLSALTRSPPLSPRARRVSPRARRVSPRAQRGGRNPSGFALLPSHQLNRVPFIQFAHQHIHPIPRRGAHRRAHHIGLDRELAASAVDQHAEQNPFGSAEVGALIECRPHRPAGVEHVVYYHHGAAVEVGQAGLAHHWTGADGLQIV